MSLIMYLFNYLSPFDLLLSLVISEHLLRTLNPIDLDLHGKVFFYKFVLLQVRQPLVYLQRLLLVQALQLRPLTLSLRLSHLLEEVWGPTRGSCDVR